MREMLDEKLARFEELEAMMSDPEVLSDAGKMAGVAREHGALGKIATKYRNFRNLNDQILETRELLEGKDAEMRELAEMEMPALKEEREKVWNEILELTIGGEDATRSRCVMTGTLSCVYFRYTQITSCLLSLTTLKFRMNPSSRRRFTMRNFMFDAGISTVPCRTEDAFRILVSKSAIGSVIPIGHYLNQLTANWR